MSDVILPSSAELALCISNNAATVLSASGLYADRLGCSIQDLVGRCWHEWVPAAELPRIGAMTARAFGGEPVSTVSMARRSDGRRTFSRVLLMPVTMTSGMTAVIGIHSSLYTPVLATDGQSPAFDVASYVADLAAELARTAARHRLTALAASLETLAGEAGELTASLGARPH